MKQEYIKTIVQLAIAEDLGEGDITSDNLIPKNSSSKARLIAKGDGVICGTSVAREVFKTLNGNTIFNTFINDGETVKKGETIAEIFGSTRALLSGERVAINLLLNAG